MTSSSSANTADTLRRVRVLPVIVLDRAEDAVPLAEALEAGGMPIAEVTFRTDAAPEAIRRIARQCPQVLVGAGTVLSSEQARQAADAGAQFIVSPGLNPAVVTYCQSIGMPIYPGVCTPTEIEQARTLGLRLVKFFPAEVVGGAKFIEAIGGVYRDMEFIPTGGIRRDMIARYLATGRVVACGGSWMAPAAWLHAGAFEKVRAEAEATMAELSSLGTQT